MLRYLLLVIAILCALWSPTADAADKNKSVSPEDRYELGLRHMRRGYYTKALEQFNRVRNYHRDDPVSVKAELAIADVYFKKGDFEQARLAYEDFARLHPRHENLDYVVWKIGQCLFKDAPAIAQRDLTRARQAVNIWAGYEQRFPDSKHLDDVTRLRARLKDRLALKELQIARFYAERAIGSRTTIRREENANAWLAARRRAEDMVQRYPDSAWVPEALALVGRAYHEWGLQPQAHEARERLATIAPESAWLRRLDRVLARPPGQKPNEPVFIRPYRVPTPSGPTPGQTPT